MEARGSEMIVAVLSDIHANACALESVMQKCKNLHTQKIWFLGDIIGRGPDPLYSVDWMINQVHMVDENSWLIGNHDAMLVGLYPQDMMSQTGSNAKLITAKHQEKLQSNKVIWNFVENHFNQSRLFPKCQMISGTCHLLTHGGISDFPDYRYSYPWNSESYFRSEFLKLIDYAGCADPSTVLWYGHTHIPALISAEIHDNCMKIVKYGITPGASFKIDPGRFWLINPGSVGQPRDLDTRPSFVILNTDTAEVMFTRSEYDIQRTVEAMTLDNYPQKTIDSFLDASADNIPADWCDHFKMARTIR
jgi:predicted phosphodiesterase